MSTSYFPQYKYHRNRALSLLFILVSPGSWMVLKNSLLSTDWMLPSIWNSLMSLFSLFYSYILSEKPNTNVTSSRNPHVTIRKHCLYPYSIHILFYTVCISVFFSGHKQLASQAHYLETCFKKKRETEIVYTKTHTCNLWLTK